jgi:hypothetical protein
MKNYDISDVIMNPQDLMDRFLGYLDTLDEAGKERLWERMDMDNYDPQEMEPAAFKKRLEEQTLEMKKEMKKDMPGIIKKINDEFDWIITPWWKKVLVKLGLMNR